MGGHCCSADFCSDTQIDGSCFDLLAQHCRFFDGGEIGLDHGMGGGDERDRRLLLADEEIHGRDLRHQKPGRDSHSQQSLFRIRMSTKPCEGLRLVASPSHATRARTRLQFLRRVEPFGQFRQFCSGWTLLRQTLPFLPSLEDASQLAVGLVEASSGVSWPVAAWANIVGISPRSKTSADRALCEPGIADIGRPAGGILPADCTCPGAASRIVGRRLAAKSGTVAGQIGIFGTARNQRLPRLPE